MAWTTEQKIALALRMPWTVIPETTPEGDQLLRVAELPAAVATGKTKEELERDFWESLEATVAAYFEFGDQLPRPKLWNGPLPWDITPVGAGAVGVRVVPGTSQIVAQQESGVPATSSPQRQDVVVGAA